LLANSARNGLDGQLHDAGLRFVRSADDLVVLCQSEVKVQEAHALVQQHLDRIGLTLSAAKTKRTKFREGVAFLGFTSTARSVTMRAKSVEKYKTKIRDLTPRHHHLDRAVVAQVKAVLRGTANSFATSFSRCRSRFRALDGWLRMRLRAMKFKRPWHTDNRRLGWTHSRRLGFIFLSDALVPPAVEPT
jgi:RNA-directed DNA polymerase